MSEILSKKEIEQFVHKGFVCIENAFSKKIADEVLDILWNDLPCDRSHPSTWTEPVIRLGMYTQQPFLESLNSKKMHLIYNQLIGENKWIPCLNVGTFPIRFPSVQQPNDIGKHVDASFAGDEPNNYFEWRVNIKSKGRALLMLVLYSDVSENDAPTVLYEQSHMDVAKLLADKGDRGLSILELAGKLDDMPKWKSVDATGKAGTVYLCHPFMVHSAQAHKGTDPKFMAQPALLVRDELSISNSSDMYSPVEEAICLALM